MSETAKRIATVMIEMENRNGSFYISSDDIPGLWMWGRDLDQMLLDIIPTIEELYKLNQGQAVNVKVSEKPDASRYMGVDRVKNRYDIYERAEDQRGHING